jgi:hypothetical protein
MEDRQLLNSVLQQDPSLQGGRFSKVYERNCQVEMKIVETNILQLVGQEVSSTEALTFKILQQNKARDSQWDQPSLERNFKSLHSNSQRQINKPPQKYQSAPKPGGSAEVIRLELLSESDFFFQYELEVDSFLFGQMKEKLKLKASFEEFLTMLVKLLNGCIEDPEHFKCLLIINTDSSATLKILKDLEFKTLEQLSLNLRLGDQDQINRQVSHRFKLSKLLLRQNQARLQQVAQILKLKNPSLIAQINKQAIISGPYHMRMQEARPLDQAS